MAGTEPIGTGRVSMEAYARFVTSATDFAISFLARDGRIASWNAGAERIHGCPEGQAIGLPMSTFYTPAEVAAKKPQYDLRLAAADGLYSDEGWRLRKDGSMFWAGVTFTALKEPSGDVRGFVMLTRDHTARKHAEEALRQSEERHRLLVESVKDYAIFMLDRTGRIMSWNEGARRLKGYEAEEIVGQHFSRFYRRDDIERDHPARELETALKEGRYEEEGWRVRKDGTEFWANVTITALRDSNGRHVGFAKVTRDLTIRKQAEEDLKARALSYANLNRELDAFSHAVAHDIRSPVRAVEHLSSNLLEEEGARLTPGGQEDLRAIHTTALSMARLVQDLLELSTASASEPDRTDVDLTELAVEVCEELKAREPDRVIECRVQKGLRSAADRSLLRIALANLVANAMKFSRKKPKTTISIGEEDTKEGPAFFVRDNGGGFDPSRASELFHPFTRLHSVSEYEGTGIGLATVARIIRRHHGKVWAEGVPGQGATFRFTLGEARS